MLLEALKDKTDVKPITDDCSFLTRYAVVYRYPFSPDVDENEARLAIAHAERVKQWTESIVQLDEGKSHDNGAKDKEAKSMEAIDDKR